MVEVTVAAREVAEAATVALVMVAVRVESVGQVMVAAL